MAFLETSIPLGWGAKSAVANGGDKGIGGAGGTAGTGAQNGTKGDNGENGTPGSRGHYVNHGWGSADGEWWGLNGN